MSAGAVPSLSALMTTEELLALPENGYERELIRGRLRERPMTRRNRWHSHAMVRLGRFLDQWLAGQPEPRGQVVGGEAGFRLSRNPDSSVGIDVAYVSADVVAKTPESAPYFDGPPVLAVEILSPSDTQEDVTEKVEVYQESGVALVWIVDPVFRTMLVHRQGGKPELFNDDQELSGEPHLPGFRVPVAEVFRS